MLVIPMTQQADPDRRPTFEDIITRLERVQRDAARQGTKAGGQDQQQRQHPDQHPRSPASGRKASAGGGFFSFLKGTKG